VKDAYPFPRMDDGLDALGEENFFSTLDCNAGYWQIPVPLEDRHLTKLICHSGKFQCKRLPFGLCNAPAAFQGAIDMLLAGVKWRYVLVHLDDIILFSQDAETHLSHLDKVFTLLGNAGVKLKEKNCHLFSNKVEYLGLVFRPGRISVNEKNLKAIRKAQFPETQSELRSFLGMCNIHRRFTDSFAKHAKPLNRLASTALPKRLATLTQEEQEAFNKLRELLCNPLILALLGKEGKYIIDVDASYHQLGCSLLQEYTSGEYHPLGYFSKGLTLAEKSYTVTEIEGLGEVWAVSLLRPYSKGTHFLIRCDHQALWWGRTTTTCTNNRLNRWRVRLAEFNYDVEYKPGRRRALADAMSRIPTEGKDEDPIPEEIPVVGVRFRRVRGRS